MFKNTAFNFTRSKLRKWPVVEVYNLLDYSLADEYKDISKYVWLKNKNEKIIEEFNWGWHPENKNQYNVHTFAKCNKRTKQPLNWNIIKLVPTDPALRISVELKAPYIASYTNNKHSVFLYNLSNVRTDKKLEKFNSIEYTLLKDVSTVDDAILKVNTDNCSDHVWLINVDVSLSFDFFTNTFQEFVPIKKGYSWAVDHLSTNCQFVDNSVLLLPKTLIKNLKDNSPVTEKIINITYKNAGILNDMNDPFEAWAYSYYNTILLKINDSKEHTIREILQNNIINKSIIKGREQANKDYPTFTDETIDNAFDFNWLKTRFIESNK